MLLMSGFTGPVAIGVGPQALLLLVSGSTGPVAIGVGLLCLSHMATDTQWHGSQWHGFRFLQTVLLSNSQLAHTTCIVHLFCNHLLVTAHGQDWVCADL